MRADKLGFNRQESSTNMAKAVQTKQTKQIQGARAKTLPKVGRMNAEERKAHEAREKRLAYNHARYARLKAEREALAKGKGKASAKPTAKATKPQADAEIDFTLTSAELVAALEASRKLALKAGDAERALALTHAIDLARLLA